ncbi:ABC transporter ATP-binding protein [Aeromicrobium wangtongii]|uniref:ATP-binding cassette domain-containing protein n=1 Tax=Aeromicrobium wangtongii TaxID=2969247 RepID=A0ABY5MGH7_9ACTN|nr:ATP-binding cassette domain-containing protein [Aeromicrobium wangtongii]MCD9197489.1 ATP-binding cassette domain-containing protein [Aeromicrobium wangtongii]MCL3818404.1 ATP-binding cassette domain-containing protein [Aeromicrobium wangtongii]UUP14981.1 ATP-binding cassette domain-containing protein [Aeromicrobium wangtongii]
MLDISHLSRAYGDAVVVDDVSFSVRPGRVTGFVGGNGAGKTTTMRMILGVLAPTSGEVLWNGAPISTGQRRRFGYMPEERGLYPRMRITEQLVFLARLHGIERAEATRRAHELLGHFDLAERADDVLDTLSLGNQQRVQIAAALIHRPDALVLDEPFSGLDPVAVDQMADLLAKEAGDKPLLFSSHQLDLVERLCDDLVILSHGRVVAAGPVDELRGKGPDRYRIVLAGADAAWLRDLRGIQVRDVDGPVALVDLDGTTPSDLLAAVIARGPVVEFSPVRQPLSAIFREVAR